MQVVDFLVSGTYIVRLRDVPIPDSTAKLKGGQRILTILNHVTTPPCSSSNKIVFPCLHVADVDENAYFLDPATIASAQFLNQTQRIEA